MKKYLHSAPTASIEMSHNTLNSWTSEAMPTSLGVSVRRTYGFKWRTFNLSTNLDTLLAVMDSTLNGPAQRSSAASLHCSRSQSHLPLDRRCCRDEPDKLQNMGSPLWNAASRCLSNKQRVADRCPSLSVPYYNTLRDGT